MKRNLSFVGILMVMLLTATSSGGSGVGLIYEDVIVEDDVLTVEEMASEMQYLADEISEFHPILMDRDASKEFDDNVNKLIRHLPKQMGASEFAYELAKVSALLDEPHTYVSPAILSGGDYYQENAIDLRTMFTDGAIYVMEDNHYFSKGDEILAIGAYSYNELMETLDGCISNSNEYGVYTMAVQYLTDYNFYYYINAADENGIVAFEIMDENSEIKIVNVDLNMLKNTSLPSYGTKMWDMTFDDDNSAAVFEIYACDNSDEMINAVKEFYTIANEGQYEKIILDVRNNRGGYADFHEYLLMGIDDDSYQYIDGSTRANKYRDDAYVCDGDFYILTSNYTFSSAIMLTAVFQYNDFAVVVGQPTGDTCTIYGVPNEIRSLPRTQLKYTIGQ